MRVPEQLELFPGTDANELSLNAEQNAPVVFPRTGKKPSAVIWQSPKNGAVPFPADRQIAHVRRVARALDGRDERLAAKYWRTECNRLVGRLQVQGFDAATIRAEVIRFGNAVAQHRADDGRQRPTGGAA